MKNFAERLEEAMQYIFIAAKEGYLDEDLADEILKKSDEEIIEWAEEQGARGDAAAGEYHSLGEKDE